MNSAEVASVPPLCYTGGMMDRAQVIRAEQARWTGQPTTVMIREECFEATWVKLKDILKDPEADCPGVHDLACPTFIVDGPSVGKWTGDEDSIVGIREVRQLADRTCMEVQFTDGTLLWGTFSGMRFLRVDGAVAAQHDGEAEAGVADLWEALGH